MLLNTPKFEKKMTTTLQGLLKEGQIPPKFYPILKPQRSLTEAFLCVQTMLLHIA